MLHYGTVEYVGQQSGVTSLQSIAQEVQDAAAGADGSYFGEGSSGGSFLAALSTFAADVKRDYSHCWTS
jgi:hypothetical protein